MVRLFLYFFLFLFYTIMSFFGFDPMAPPGQRPNTKTLDFNDLDEDDALNDETFGSAAISNLGNRFDFSMGGLNDTKSTLVPAPLPSMNASLSYASAAHSSVDDVLQPMASLWSDEKPTENVENQTQHQVLSLEEIEAKLKTQNLPSQPQPQQLPQQVPQQQQQQQFPMMQNNMQFQIPPYITQMLLQPAIHQQILSAVSSGRFSDVQSATLAMVQMLMTTQSQMMQMPNQYANPNNMNMPPNLQPMHQQQMNMAQQQIASNVQSDSQHQIPPHSQLQNQVPSTTSTPIPQQQQQQNSPAQADISKQVQQKVNLADFPSIETASSQTNGHVNHNDSNTNYDNEASNNLSKKQELETNNNFPQNQHQHHNQNSQFNQRQQRSFNNNQMGQRNNHHHNNYNFHRQQQLQQQLENMSPEERDHFLIRQQKVQRITRSSGFMTPKDKDFVTRFQLSQIVTDDPYNEDFYSQVYKVLNSSTGENNMNSLAQKYLEQSGHRLGGRSKRADIALQRMQQQVSKAVSVAKERGESTGILTKAGALGKVSFGSGKQPRRQLIINNHENNENEDSNTSESNKQNEIVLPKEFTFSKSARTFQLSIIEKIYNEVLKLESLERENQAYDSNELWKSLHLNDIIKTSSNEIVNPFISLLAFDKMMKLFGRMFHFLTSEQKIELISTIFINLSNIDVIRKGSYKNYENSNYEIPDDVIKKIDLFQLTVLKNLVLYLSESNFTYVLSWLNALVVSGTISFLVTTKIGLSLITVLISRLELIKQEFSTSLTANELSQWQTVYDQLFKSIEGIITSCFPPYVSHDDAIKITNKQSNDDDSYIWQFLASLSLTGKLNHQRIIVDEIRNEIFGVMAIAKTYKTNGDLEKSTRYLSNLNLFLNAMGLIATEDDITQLSD